MRTLAKARSLKAVHTNNYNEKGNKKSVLKKADFLLYITEGKIDSRVYLSFCFRQLVLPVMLCWSSHQ